jgi:hypothetical protein
MMALGVAWRLVGEEGLERLELHGLVVQLLFCVHGFVLNKYTYAGLL